jgi:ELWxxDGT repeat protein
MVKEINPATDAPGLDTDSLDLQFTKVNEELLFFVADDGTHGIELWVSDGTAGGTHMVKDIIPPTAGPTASPYGLRAVGDKLFFGVPDGVHGGELWVSDGTEAGTHIVKDINDGSDDGYLGHNGSIAAGNTLYFRATDGSSGEELWVSDGTEDGTVRVADLAAGASSSNPTYFSYIGNSIYFYASGTEDYGLWKIAVPDDNGTTTTTTTIISGCVDNDGDGYGEGPDCLGPDCDDAAPALHDNCTTCIDLDDDGYGQGELCLGTDCDDEDPLVWDNCTTCTVKIFPRRLSRLFSIIRPFRLFLFKAADGLQFAKDTPIVFSDEAAEALFQFPLGKKKRFMLAMVRIRAPLLQATDSYEVNVGGCAGSLKIKVF